MIITVLPVPPPCVRPSVSMDRSGTGHDDLTGALSNVIRFSNAIKRDGNRTSVESKVLLQLHVTSLIDNDVSGVGQSFQRGGRPIKSLSARLKGKEGRIRGNLMGKRVDFSARTVITGDPHISIEEVGVPRSIAKNLTFPEKVCDYNIKVLQKYVDNGINYPGAKYVTRKNGSCTSLKYATKLPVLEVGDVVERHIITGDTILFNRQPSLHKMSMMAHKVRVMDYSTFRMNVNVCSSYNADFDGDEMNLHMPQNYAAIAELETLSTVPKLLISPQANKPVNALVQDALCGIRKFTKRDVFLTKDKVMDLVLWMKNWRGVLPTPAILKPIPLWTGKQIISEILPAGLDLISYHSTHADFQEALKKVLETGKTDGTITQDESKLKLQEFNRLCPYDTKVEIQNGELLTGIICKKTVGSTAGGIIHIIWNDMGSDVTRDFMDDAAQVVNQWLLHEGFSVGLGDAIISRKATDAIEDIVNVQMEKIEIIHKEYKQGLLKIQGNQTVEETKENLLQGCLARARDAACKIASKYLPAENNIKQMIEAGSKGSILNSCQISACVGQQIVEGKRMPAGFTDRSLPHYSKYDDSPQSRGFVRNSFIRGLQPQELFFHAMGGREGLIDTAVKTSETGYIQRRLVKALEDISVKYDGTVRNNRGDVIQLYYGEDGFDGTAIENQVFETMMLSNEKFEKEFCSYELMDTEFVRLQCDRQYLRENLRIAEDKWALPLNLKRIFNSAKRKIDSSQKNDKLLTAEYVYNIVEKLRSTVNPSRLKISLIDECPTILFGIMLSSVFCTRNVLRDLTWTGFHWAVQEIQNKYQKGLVHAGESVGVITAQSIGEPATQMTLNTFHLSGTGNKTVTSGIPRLKELINAAKNLKTPGMTICLTEECRFSKKEAYVIKSKLEHACIEDVTSLTEIYYDPDYKNSSVVEDREWTELLNSIPDEDAPDPDKLYPWVLRIVLDREEMIKRNISIYQIEDNISKIFEEDLFIQHSDDNSEKIVMHFRILRDEDDASEEHEFLNGNEFFKQIIPLLLCSITICGIPGIEKAFVSDQSIVAYEEDGSLATNKREYIIETDGINIKDTIHIEGVDSNRIVCNASQEMLSIFGIEVARESLINEIRSVIGTGGSYINYRHLALLCDVMTNRGQIMAVTRHGLNRMDSGPLAKCTFEQTVDILTESGINGEIDNLKGVAENIMIGKIAPLGTGMMTIMLDDEMYSKFDSNTMKGAVVERTKKSTESLMSYSPLKPSYLLT